MAGNSKQSRTHAIKTTLGGTVNGPFRDISFSKTENQLAMAQRISAVKKRTWRKNKSNRTSQRQNLKEKSLKMSEVDDFYGRFPPPSKWQHHFVIYTQKQLMCCQTVKSEREETVCK